MRTLIDFLGLLMPFWQFLHLMVMGGLVVYAVYSLAERFDALLALFVVCLLWSSAVVAVWLLFALQTEWGIELVPKLVRQALYAAIRIAYPFEILIWSAFAFLFIRRNRAGTNEERGE